MTILALASMSQKSPTFDEQGFITRGLGYLRGENRTMRVGHPLGLNALNAAFLTADDTVQLPLDDPSWKETDFHRPSELFLWEIGNNVEHIMFLARLPSIWLGMLLAAIAGRWAWRLSGSRWAGLLALSLIALDPNILANMRLATTDLGLALGVTIAGFTLWRFLQRPSWSSIILAGMGMGLLQNTKFTAVLFVPLFGLVILVGVIVRWREEGRFPGRPSLMLITAYPLVAFLTLWAMYGFQIGTLSQEVPIFPQLAGLTLPLSHHIEQMLDIGGRLQVETPSFLLGQYSDTGWWYYFPVAFLLKTPLPTLIIFTTAFILRIAYYIKNSRPTDYGLRITDHGSRVTLLNDAALLIPALGYFAIALTSDINLGYRHLLPLLPFLAVFSSNSLAPYLRSMSSLKYSRRRQAIRYVVPALLASLLFITLWIYPHYLSYFNVLAGGPNNGWRYLVDSNSDWGQDLGALKPWLAEREVANVWLSYFGEARPEYYNIPYTGLDSWPPRLMNPEARPYYPYDPAPGLYAISATNLQGVHFANHDQFAWFREREPVAKIGYSIFLYEVPARGEPVDVALGNVQLDEIVPEDFALFGSNDVTPHWFDPAQSVLIPPQNSWLALSNNTAVPKPFIYLTNQLESVQVADNYTIYRVMSVDSPPIRSFTDFNVGEGTIRFRGLALESATAVAGQTIRLNSDWAISAEPAPLKIFIHLMMKDGEIAAQWDGLGAAWEGLRDGDTLFQAHQITIPKELPPGEYDLWLGLYNPETGERYLTTADEKAIIPAAITVEAGG